MPACTKKPLTTCFLMVLLTLKYGATEKTLANWGYADAVLTLRSRSASTFEIRKAGDDPANVADIPYQGQVTIYRDRTGSGTAWSNGSILFQGRRVEFSGAADPGSASTAMTFVDPWWDLENIVFQHYWKSGSPPVNVYSARLNLFQDIHLGPASPWTSLSVKDQIAEIINYAHANCSANLQPGIIDPAWQFPFYGVKAITCAEAILTCLRSIPDAVTWFDYTTTPPTLHVRQAANLTRVTLPYAGADAHSRAHQSSTIRARPDLQLPQVVIQYQQTSSVDNVKYTAYVVDAYPPLATGQAIGAQVIPIDLRGGNRSDVSGTVIAQAIDPTSLDFWKKYKPDLTLPEITSLGIVDSSVNAGSSHPKGITIKDESGATVSLASFPNAIIGGQVAPWMPVTAREVTITGTLTYGRQFDIAHNPSAPIYYPLANVSEHTVSVRVKLTNAPPGSTSYSTVASYDPADPVPVGLAQYIYNSFNTLQFEGRHTIVDDHAFQILGPQFSLNLSGGNAAWTSMNAVVHETQILFNANRSGVQVVSFGPHKHLTAAQFFDFLSMWTWRQIYENPNVRNTGVDADATGIALGQDMQKENTSAGTPQVALQSVVGAPDADGHVPIVTNTGVATLGEHNHQSFDNTGAFVNAKGIIALSRSDIDPSDLPGIAVKLRKLAVCKPDGTAGSMYVLASQIL